LGVRGFGAYVRVDSENPGRVIQPILLGFRAWYLKVDSDNLGRVIQPILLGFRAWYLKVDSDNLGRVIQPILCYLQTASPLRVELDGRLATVKELVEARVWLRLKVADGPKQHIVPVSGGNHNLVHVV
jgi:(2Fe-2S) ferredoxin